MKTDQIRIMRHGTLKIVSSGYGDRFVMQDIHFDITVNGLEFRIDNQTDRVAAYLRLTGHDLQNLPDDVFKSAVEIVRGSKISTWITYRTGDTMHTIETTARKIEAGIHAATGYDGLSEFGRNEFEPIAKTLSPYEWEAVRYGLQTINDAHEKTGKPIVEFTIPEQEA